MVGQAPGSSQELTSKAQFKVMHLNVGGGQLGYLSQYQVFLSSERCNGLVLGMPQCLPLSGVLPG